MTETARNIREDDFYIRTELATEASAGSGFVWKQNLLFPAEKISAKSYTRVFSPANLKTLLDSRQLQESGLRLIDYEASKWLVDIDADELSGDKPCAAWLPALKERIDALRMSADEEELPFSEASAADAVAFASCLNATVQPGCFLIGNGNIRLLWSNDIMEQIGIQFLGDGEAQYVLLASRGEKIARSMGTDQHDMLPKVISAARLRHLLNQ